MPRMLTVLAIFIAAPSTFADDPDWIDLTNPKETTVWKGKFDGWTFAETVGLNDQNPKLLSFKGEGKVLVNGEKGRAKDLITMKTFTDVELHAEFLIAKGSNSGIKFHAVYEI